MSAVLVVLAVVIIYVFYQWWAGRLPNLPGPWGVPIVGYLPFLGRQMNVTLTELSKTYGDVYQIQVGSRRLVVVCGHKAVKAGLTGTKGLEIAARPDFSSYSGFGVFGEHGYKPHHRYCKKLTLRAMTLFGDERKIELLEIGQRAVNMFFEEVDKLEGKSFDPKPLLYTSVWSIMSYICYGEAFERDDPQVAEIFSTVEVFGRSVMFGVISDYLPWTKILLQKQMKQMNELMTKIGDLSKQLAARNFSTWDGKSTRTMADLIRLAGQELETNKSEETGDLTDDALQDMLVSLFGAGFGTVASITRWSMLLLGKWPEHQVPVHEELDRVLGDSPPTFDDATRLPVTMATLAEIYRYSSMSGLGITHATTCNTELLGHPIPADIPVIFNLYSAHYDSSVFNKPHLFNPARFLDDSGEKVNAGLVDQIMPYGLGWRRCGGEPLAKMEIFLFFVSLLQQRRIVCPSGETLDPKRYIMTLGLDPLPFKIQLEKRH